MMLQGSAIYGIISSSLRIQQLNSSRRLQHLRFFQNDKIKRKRSNFLARCDTKDDWNSGMNINNSINKATNDVNDVVQAGTAAQSPSTDTEAKPVEKQHETKQQKTSSASQSDSVTAYSTLADLNLLLGIDEQEEEKLRIIQKDTHIKLETVPQLFTEALHSDRFPCGKDPYNYMLEIMSHVINSAKKLAENGYHSQLGQQVDALIDKMWQKLGLGNGVDKSDVGSSDSEEENYILKFLSPPVLEKALWLGLLDAKISGDNAKFSAVLDELQRIVNNDIEQEQKVYDLINLEPKQWLKYGMKEGEFKYLISRVVRDYNMTVIDVRAVDEKQKVYKDLIPAGVLFRGYFPDYPSNDKEPGLPRVWSVSDFMVGLHVVPSHSKAYNTMLKGPTQMSNFLVVLSAVLTISTITTVSASFSLSPILPEYVQQWLQAGYSFQDGQTPPEIVGVPTVAQLFAMCGPIQALILGQQLFHEIGHELAACYQQELLGLRYLIPSPLIGTCGSSMKICSIVKNRKYFWDLASAGPIFGGALSLIVFGNGLFMSVSNSLQPYLVPVPPEFISGSQFLGAITKLVVGEEVMNATSTVMLHPFLIAGWCGLYATSLSLLPIGSLDGGRMTQAAFGRRTLGYVQIFTYGCLALGLLGGSMGFPFGLYTILFQREVEKQISDRVRGVGGVRQVLTGVFLVLAVLILVPSDPISRLMINQWF